MDDDLPHHLRRELQERKLAEAADDPAVRAIHLQMAEEHAGRAREARIRAGRARMDDSGFKEGRSS